MNSIAVGELRFFLKEKQTRFAAQNVRVVCLTETNAVGLPSSASDASSLGQNLSLKPPPPVIRDVQANMFLFFPSCVFVFL